MKEKKFIKLTPFKMQVLQSFPFIDEDFDAITNYELLCKVVEYLNKTVDNVNLLESDFKVLYDYVHDYFDNLDVREEINNKLDDMAESGQLADIIAQYLGLAGVLAFNTLNDLKGATNIVDGSICKTLGNTTYNDGYGAFYKIRTITSSDVVDNDKIVALNISNTLIAEKIFNQDIENLKNDMSLIKNKKYLLVGDSYEVGYQGSGQENIEGFFTKVKNDLNLNATIVAGNGYGFLGMNNNLKWRDLISNTNIPDKETYTDIIICGGMNDELSDTLGNEITTTINYLKTNFRNATIHLGMVGAYRFTTAENLSRIINLYYAYKNASLENGIKFIENANYLLRKTTWFIDDNIHPNTSGENWLAYGIKQYILNGIIEFNLPNENLSIIPKSNIDLSNFSIYNQLENNIIRVIFKGRISFTSPISINNLTEFELGSLSDSYIKGSPYSQGLNITFTGYVYTQDLVNNSHFVKIQFNLYNWNDGTLWLKCFTVMDNGDMLSLTNVTEINVVDGYVTTYVPTKYC